MIPEWYLHQHACSNLYEDKTSFSFFLLLVLSSAVAVESLNSVELILLSFYIAWASLEDSALSEWPLNNLGTKVEIGREVALEAKVL